MWMESGGAGLAVGVCNQPAARGCGMGSAVTRPALSLVMRTGFCHKEWEKMISCSKQMSVRTVRTWGESKQVW